MLLARNRNYRRLFAAATITNLGDGISALAFPWLASLLTRDPVLIGAVAAAGRLPWLLFSLPAGVVTDRADRQKLMVRADLARMLLTMGVVALVFAAPALPLADGAPGAGALVFGLAAAAFLLGTAEVFRDNAAQTALPSIVDEADLETANGQMWSAEQIAGQFIGPPLAGFLIAVSVPAPFVIDAATFGLAAFLVAAISMRPAMHSPPQGRFGAQLKQGASWILGHPTILTLAIMLSLLNFVTFGSFTILVLLSQDVLGLNAAGYGLLLTAGALGAVGGGLIGPAIARRLGSKPAVVASLLLFVPAFVAFALTRSPFVAGAALALETFAGMVWNVVTVSFRQRVIPPELLGRVNSIYRFFGWGSLPLGALAAGLVVAAAEPSLGRDAALRLPYWAGAALVPVLALWAARSLVIPNRAITD